MEHFCPSCESLALWPMPITPRTGPASWLCRRRLVAAQDPDPGRGEQDLAEGLHQPADVPARAAVAHTLEPVEARQLDLEPERRAALAAGERHQQAGVAALVAGGLDLLADEVDGALAVGRQQVVGEAGEVQGGPPDLAFGGFIVNHDPGRGYRRAVGAAYRRLLGRQGSRVPLVR